MKLLTKFSLAAVLAALGTSAVFADDQQLQNRLAMQQGETRLEHHVNQKLQPNIVRTGKTPTIAVYGSGRGVGRTATSARSSETRYEVRSNPHGQQMGVFVPAR